MLNNFSHLDSKLGTGGLNKNSQLNGQLKSKNLLKTLYISKNQRP